MASNLPSSFSRPSAAQEKQSSPLPQKPFAPSGSGDGNTLFIFLSILSLLISIASFYGAFYSDKPLSAGQKEALRGIADDLRALQNRDVILAAPVAATLSLDQQYQSRDMFPPTFTLNADFNLPLDTTLVGVSPTGQTVSFRVQESIPIKAAIPISSSSAFGDTTIRIKKDFPVTAKFSSTLKVRGAYGKELNSIIDRINNLTGDTGAPN